MTLASAAVPPPPSLRYIFLTITSNADDSSVPMLWAKTIAVLWRLTSTPPNTIIPPPPPPPSTPQAVVPPPPQCEFGRIPAKQRLNIALCMIADALICPQKLSALLFNPTTPLGMPMSSYPVAVT